MDDLVGRTLCNRYRVEAFIGRGGMADVYKVRDLKKSVRVAIKVLKSQFAAQPELLRDFRSEAAALARLQHPHIVRFYGLERDQGVVFIVMEYVEGQTLREEMARRGAAISSAWVLSVFRELCAALHYAHVLGYVHSDVKPGNVMLGADGTARLMDFGIAAFGGRANDDLVGRGTPAYMAPEQVRGLKPTPALDIYALGILLYEVFTGGRRPFDGTSRFAVGSDTSERIRWEQVHLPPPSPRAHNGRISLELEGVILRCLEKSPRSRYSTARSLLRALTGAVSRMQKMRVGPSEEPDDTPGLKARTVPPERRPWLKYMWLLGVLPIVLVVVLMAGGAGDGALTASTPEPAGASLPGFNPPAFAPSAHDSAPSIAAPRQPITIRAFDSSIHRSAECIVCQLADWEAPLAPGSYHWNVDFPDNTPVYILVGWCAADQATLAANWQLVDFGLEVDGIKVSLGELDFSTFTTPDGNPCNGYTGVIEDWSGGVHQYTQILHFSEALDDGWNTYQAGIYVENFAVTVR